PASTLGSTQYYGFISWYYTDNPSTVSDGSPDGGIASIGVAADDVAVSGKFEADKFIKAVIKIHAEDGYTFHELKPDALFYDGAIVKQATTWDQGETLPDITVTFPPLLQDGKIRVTEVNLAGKFAAPSKDASPQTSFNSTQYNGAVAWYYTGAPDTPISTGFATAKEIKAVVTLTAVGDYSFSGITYNNYAYTGSNKTTNDMGIGPNITVTVLFSPLPSPIDDFDLTTKFFAPVDGAPPDRFINNIGLNSVNQYRGTVSWTYTDGSSLGDLFDYGKEIKAVISLTPNQDYYFDAVGANVFSHLKAKSVTNPAAANPATVTITAIFDPLPEGNPQIISRWLDISAVNYQDNYTVDDLYREFIFYDDGTYMFMDIFKDIVAEHGYYILLDQNNLPSPGIDPVAEGTVYRTKAAYINDRSWTYGMEATVYLDGTQLGSGIVQTSGGKLGLFWQGWYVSPQNGLESPKMYYDERNFAYSNSMGFNRN
ncbi:MAG: hypothetical protein FWF29_12090, partial [Treponema sp.]|nr:hypothetical protein [Treponema sp.]